MAWDSCTDLHLQSSWLVQHSWERNRDRWLCLHEQVSSGHCWAVQPGLWLLSPYPFRPTATPVLGRPKLLPAPAHPASPLCPTPALLILPPHTPTSPSGFLHRPVIPITLCPPLLPPLRDRARKDNAAQVTSDIFWLSGLASPGADAPLRCFFIRCLRLMALEK